EPGARMYWSGDRCRLRSDGQLEYIGRRDDQVKLRGMRVELKGVEAILRQHPGVREAAVVARAGGGEEARLGGELAMREGTSVDEVREHLRERLPEYQVPGRLVRMEKLPRTANGKVNRRALPAPEQVGVEEGAGYVGARNPIEEVLAGIWAEVL